MNSTTVQGYCPVLYGGKWSSRELLSLNSIHVRKNPYGLEENRRSARDGGKIAGLGQKNTPFVSQRGIKDYNVLI